MEETILRKDDNRFVFFPIKYHDLYELYKKHISTFWTVEEVQLDKDIDDWKKLSDDERFFIKNILAFFAASDGIVLENLVDNFCSEVQIAEARAFYATQSFFENIHSEMYSLLIDTYISDTVEKDKLFRSLETNETVKKKAEWVMEYMNDKLPFSHRLIAFAAVEGIFFSGSFASIFWLKNRKIMDGLCLSNDFISRDESLHVQFACTLFKHIENKPHRETVLEIILSSLEIEKEFLTKSLPVSLIGMNAESMSEYMEFVTDHLLQMLGYKKYFFTKNPFSWMEFISLEDKTNFFEQQPSQYRKSNFNNSRKSKINISEDF